MAGGAAKTVLRDVQCPRIICAILKSLEQRFIMCDTDSTQNTQKKYILNRPLVASYDIPG